MAAITGAILAATAVAGLGMQAYGMSQQKAGYDTQAAAAQGQAQGAGIQAQGAQQEAAGAQVQVQGAGLQNQATKAITQLQFANEAQNQTAMELDARRQELQIVRHQQVARATALATGVGQTGQSARGSSAIAGGYGQISGESTTNMLGVQQNLDIGRAIFGNNAGISQQQLNYAAGGDVINQGQGMIAEGQGTIARGAGVIAQYGGQAALGQAQAGLGAGYMGLGGSIAGSAGTFANLSTNIFGRTGQTTNTLSGWYGGSTSSYTNNGAFGLY